MTNVQISVGRLGFSYNAILMRRLIVYSFPIVIKFFTRMRGEYDGII